MEPRARDRKDGKARIYLDHAATSPLRPEAWEAMEASLGEADYNPSSQHGFGQRARRRLEEARRDLAESLGVEKRRLVFTGGGTQADNLAVLGFARAHREEGPRVLVSSVEHRAVLGAARQARREAAEVVELPVDGDGVVELDALEAALEADGDRPTLVSVMWANNEVGTVQPVGRVCELAHDHGALFHTDAVQALGKCPVSLEEVPADLLTVTAHKLGGPVGIGLLYRREGVELEPLAHGGNQEKGMWPGTQNPLAATAFARVVGLALEELKEEAPRWRRLRDGMADRLREDIADLRVHAEGARERLPGLLSVGIPGCDPAVLLVTLDLEGVAASTGSACSSGTPSPSHVLEAMGIEGSATRYGVLRFSFGPETTEAEVRRAADATVRAVARVRESAPAGA